jgi:putative sterol carrier protein
MVFKVSNILSKIQSGINETIVKKINGVFKFVITNSSGEQQVWILDLKNKGEVRVGSQEDSADCILTASDDDIVGIMTGQLEPTEAYFDGRLKIDGEIGLAMKLNKLQALISSAPPQKKVDGFKSSEIFEKMSQIVKKDESTRKLNCVYQFIITSGTGKQIWTVDLKNGNVSNTESSADCILEMSDEDCVAIMGGQMDPTEAVFNGKLKIDGDMGLAMKLNKLLVKLKESSAGQSSAENQGSAGNQGISVPGYKASEIFENVKRMLEVDAQRLTKINGIYQFDIIKGDSEKQSWTVDLKNGTISLGKNNTPDCTLEMSDEDCVAIMGGKMDATEAVFSGKLKIDGDMGLAMKLKHLMPRKSKL